MALHDAAPVKYQVTVKTGDGKYSGTDNSVYIVITGSNGKTSKQLLDKFFVNDHETGESNTYSFEDEDVGSIEYVTISNEYNLISDDWYVDYIKVRKEGEFGAHSSATFPVYRWVTDHNCKKFVVLTNQTKLPQKEDSVRKEVREELIKNGSIQWDKEDMKFKELPGFINVDPEHKVEFMDRNFAFPEGKIADFKNRKVFSRLNEFYEVIAGKLNPIDNFEEFSNVTHLLGDHKFEDYGAYEGRSGEWMDEWKTDEEFGRQMLNGPNPIEVRRVKELPSNFPVTDKILEGLLQRGLTLAQEIEAGNMFIINHEFLVGIHCGKYQGEQLHLPAPICLLYLRPDDQLVPVAIQHGQQPGKEFPIWTPKDKEDDWTLAKMWFKNGDIQVSQIRTHLFYGHLISETFVIALYRNLSQCHPVFKLMREHFEFVLCNNVLARAGLIVPGGAADVSITTGQGSQGMTQLMSKSFKEFKYDDLDFPGNLKSRGVENLPNYHMRDDALLLWTAIQEYVNNMMDLYYESDEDVKGDGELKNFVEDLALNGFKGIDDGMPRNLSSKEEMCTLLMRFLFATIVRHTFANFLLFEYYRYPPNMPATMLGPIPTEKDRGKADTKKIIASLPTRELCAYQLGITWVLSQYGEAEVWLGHYPRWLFTEPEPEEVANKFRKKLKEIEDIIEKRNDKLKYPYTILKPSKIPAGIAI